MLRSLKVTLLACLLAGVGLGGAESPPEAEQPPSNIFTVTAGAPAFLSLSYERVGWSLFDLQGSTGIIFDINAEGIVDLKPFVSLGYYGYGTAWWVEVSLPREVLPLRREDANWLIVGFEYRY